MIFISHSNQDAGFVSELRKTLENNQLRTWVDCRELIAGQNLTQEILQAIDNTDCLMVVISPLTINSDWVFEEVAYALEKQKNAPDFKIVPLLIEGMQPNALRSWFGKEKPLAVTVANKQGGLLEALPQILAALGVQAPDKIEKIIELKEEPLEELILELEEPELKTETDKATLLTAKAKLIYEPADKNQRPIESAKFRFTAPIGVIELDDLRWYLEQYQIWPAGEFKKRANLIAANLPKWGEALYKSALNHESARNLAQTWRKANGQRRFSVLINDETLDEDKTPTLQAANALWALPWELLHDDVGFLAEGKQGGRVRRRLPNYKELEAFNLDLPIKVLLVSPRPTDAGYIDHRITAKPLVQALQTLGDLVELTILNPPTLQALQQILESQEFHVLHFDGHGVYDKHKGLGALCFEKTANPSERGAMDLVYADKLAAILREHRIPLVFLEACQTAQSEDNAVKSVAAALLNAGIVSVVAMTHSVLVVTAELFVREFYTHLAQGQRIGAAMLAGQRALMTDKTRFDDGSGDGFFIEDWFIPVLYQEREDPPLFHRLLPQRLQDLQHQQRQTALGDLPATPPHSFIGRSRELLAFERLLLTTPYLVITGQGGAGKTTLAVELARWLVQTRRFNKAAFVCLEHLGDTRAVLDSIGQQLLPQFSVAEHGDEKAWHLVERELKNVCPLVLLDNCESLLPDQDGKPPLAAIDLKEFLTFCSKLQQAGATLLFTSRSALPPPFAKHHALSALSESEAIALLKQVLGIQSLELPSDAGDDKKEQLKELKSFVNQLNCHARALVLVAPIAAQKGFKASNENLAAILAELHSTHPDNRERSLYASLELSLRRLSAQHRQWVQALAVFQGGFNVDVLRIVFEIEYNSVRGELVEGHSWFDKLTTNVEDLTTNVQELAAALVQVGLADYQNYGYFSIDPALSAYLKTQLAKDDYAQLQQQWLAAMCALVDFLYQQKFEDAQLAAQLTLLELPNCLALLSVLPKHADAEQTAAIAGSIEALLANLHQPKALALAVKTRQTAAATIGVWNRSQFQNKGMDIERLLKQNDLQRAYTQAEALLQQALQAGESAYQDADYDIAMAYDELGDVLRRGGLSEAALTALQQAQQRFQSLADAGNQSAAGMVSVTLTEQADCLRELGQLDTAAELYLQAIELDEKRNALRDVAVGKGQLASVRLLQKDYPAALAGYAEARELFVQLNEPQTLATIWHQTGMVYKAMQDFETAERCYRKSLNINSQQGNQAGIASSLGELGNLYNARGRLEQAVVFYRQASDSHIQLGDKAGEGRQRYNLANSLIKLQRYEEARVELQRVIECDKAFGHSAQPWKTWAILCDLEQASHNPTAAQAAKQQAIQCYLAYRRDGGENMSGSDVPQLCQAVLQAIRDNNSAAVLEDLRGFENLAGLPDYLKPVIPKLIAILQGERNPSLADDPELDYDDAAELLLLLEQLTDNIP
jgi:hypothetical protein